MSMKSINRIALKALSSVLSKSMDQKFNKIEEILYEGISAQAFGEIADVLRILPCPIPVKEQELFGSIIFALCEVGAITESERVQIRELGTQFNQLCEVWDQLSEETLPDPEWVLNKVRNWHKELHREAALCRLWAYGEKYGS